MRRPIPRRPTARGRLALASAVLAVVSCSRAEVRTIVDGGTGRIVERATWVGPVRHGLFEIFYPDGQPKEFGRFERGVRTGHWTTWHPEGVLGSKGRYDPRGRRYGRWTWWHPSGHRAEAGVYVDGLRDGTWIAWSEDGRPSTEQSWDRGTWIATRPVE